MALTLGLLLMLLQKFFVGKVLQGLMELMHHLLEL